MFHKLPRLLFLLALALSCASIALPQDDKKVLAEVTVNAEDPIYKNLRNLSSSADAFSGDYATVSNVVLKEDAGTFTLTRGEIYFLTPVEGRVTGAVFIGTGEFSLTPPTPTEQQHLSIFVNAPTIKESFGGLTMFFTDKTFEMLKGVAGVTMGKSGPQADKARSMYRDKERLLRTVLHYNIQSRMLADVYAPARTGFFATFIDGEHFNKLIYTVDPQGIAEIYPEQVELTSYGETDGGIWTAFHMAAEYKRGTANSWTDRRTFDIKHHDMDVVISGTKLKVTDLATLEMREANSRFIPFDLFRSLRVQSVTDESGNAVPFVQEKKEEDADFGVILAEGKTPGTPFKLKITYEGNEALREAGSGNFILIPRSTWYPNNPETAFGDRASFDLTFHYPKKNVMVGVGDRIGDDAINGDTKTSKWSSGSVELAVAGFNYGDFKQKELKDATTGLNLEVFTNRVIPDEMRGLQLEAESQGANSGLTLGGMNTTSMGGTVLTEAQNATRIYSAFFGKLPYQRLAMTQQPAGFFGQAWPTLVFMPYTAFFDDTTRVQLFGIGGGTDGFWREVAAHEVAHQWWGHSVGWTSYHDQWMSEGFAEFSTSLFILYVKKDVGKFVSFWDEQKKRILEATPRTMGKKPYTVGPVTQGYRLNSAKTGAVAQSMIYPKGAYILHMIRMMMYDRTGSADKNFQAAMSDLVASHMNQDISTNDFKLALEKHIVPNMDVDKNGKLDWFFDEWVYGTEMPSYKFTYQFDKDASGNTTLTGKVEQSGVSSKFAMRVPVYLDYGKGPFYLGSATIVGNSTVELQGIKIPPSPKSASVAALNDILAAKIENVRQ
ncbi:MAG TPA: M1 family aminopeptidase [Pyrinomonadaceae bacterium]|nr:M1 family aminopeptidase [Pyrinomonadaceae bacterium]